MVIGTVYTCSGVTLDSNVFKGSSYTHSVMRSCTMAENTRTASSSTLAPFAANNLNLRLRSNLVTFSNPHDRHTDTAFVDHAL